MDKVCIHPTDRRLFNDLCLCVLCVLCVKTDPCHTQETLLRPNPQDRTHTRPTSGTFGVVGEFEEGSAEGKAKTSAGVEEERWGVKKVKVLF
jgi:hypothetical protein